MNLQSPDVAFEDRDPSLCFARSATTSDREAPHARRTTLDARRRMNWPPHHRPALTGERQWVNTQNSDPFLNCPLLL